MIVILRYFELFLWNICFMKNDLVIEKCLFIMLSGLGPRFTNIFSIAIQIRWKFHFTLISILIQWSLQNFVHGTTAVLSWPVQKFGAIWWPATELPQGEVSIEFELRAKKHQWNEPQTSGTSGIVLKVKDRSRWTEDNFQEMLKISVSVNDPLHLWHVSMA